MASTDMGTRLPSKQSHGGSYCHSSATKIKFKWYLHISCNPYAHAFQCQHGALVWHVCSSSGVPQQPLLLPRHTAPPAVDSYLPIGLLGCALAPAKCIPRRQALGSCVQSVTQSSAQQPTAPAAHSALLFRYICDTFACAWCGQFAQLRLRHTASYTSESPPCHSGGFSSSG